jgi:hypothetical protein
MTEVRLNTLDLPPPDKCRAFITHWQSRFDFHDVSRFATRTITIATRSIFPDTADEDQEALPIQISNILKWRAFNPDYDYVVLCGDPLLQSTTMFVLGGMVKTVTILRHDNQMRAYWPFRLTMPTHRS